MTDSVKSGDGARKCIIPVLFIRKIFEDQEKETDMKIKRMILVLIAVMLPLLSGCGDLTHVTGNTETQSTAPISSEEEEWSFDPDEMVDITLGPNNVTSYYDLGRHKRIGTLTIIPDYRLFDGLKLEHGVFSAEKIVFAEGFESITQEYFPQLDPPSGYDPNRAGAKCDRWTCKEIVIPKSAKDFEFGVFSICGVEKITVHEENPYFISVDGILFTKDRKTLVLYPNGRRDEEYIIPQTVENIERHAFAANPYIKKVVFHDNVKDIGDGTFYDCSSLESVVLPDGITRIGNYTFSRTAIREIIIPDSVEIIYRCAFENSVKLEKVFVPKSVKTVMDSAFAGCSSLGEIVFEDDDFMPEDESAFYGTLWYHERAEKYDDLFVTKELSDGGIELVKYKGTGESVRIPEGITSIALYSFMHCAPKEVIFPISLLSKFNGSIFVKTQSLFPLVERFAIAGGDKVKRFFEKDGAIFYENNDGYCTLYLFPPAKTGTYEFPEGMKRFGEYSIGSTALTEIIFPDSVTELGIGYNFSYIPNLESIYVGKYTDVRLINKKYHPFLKRRADVELEPTVIEDMDGDGITDIRLPDNFLSVDKNLFLDLNEVGTVFVPKTLDYIPVFEQGDNETVKINKVVYEEGTEKINKYNTLRIGDSIKQKYNDHVIDCDEVYVPLSAIIECILIPTKAVVLEENDDRYIVRNGVLYTKSGGYLIRCLRNENNREIIVPDGVYVIDDYAFSGVSELEKVVLPDTLERIGRYAFKGCLNLESISITPSVMIVYPDTFMDCHKLKEVVFDSKKTIVEPNAFRNTLYERIINNIKKSDLE